MKVRPQALSLQPLTLLQSWFVTHRACSDWH